MAPIARKGGLTREKHGSLLLDSGATQRVGLSGGNWYYIEDLCDVSHVSDVSDVSDVIVIVRSQGSLFVCQK